MTDTVQKNILELTAQAVTQIKLLIKNSKNPVLGIRIGIRSGGCSGLTYYLEYADAKKPYDEIIEQHGITLLIDPKALMYLIGTEMDYSVNQFKSGFVFLNPNEKGRCGCGKSFAV